MITPALSTAQFTTSDGMTDMKSMLETYFRSGTKQQLLAEQYLRPMGSGESNARASSALEGPICEALTNMNRHVRVRTCADEDEDQGARSRDGSDMFTWSWLDKLGDQLMLNPSFDARPYGEEENRRVDSGYAGEQEEYLASQRQALDSARRAQINRLRGARRQDMQKGFTLEELMAEDDGEPIDPNEVRALLFSYVYPHLTSILATVLSILGYDYLHIRLRRRRPPYQPLLLFSLVDPRSSRPWVLHRLYCATSSHPSLQHTYNTCSTLRQHQHSSPQQAPEEEESRRSLQHPPCQTRGSISEDRIQPRVSHPPLLLSVREVSYPAHTSFPASSKGTTSSEASSDATATASE